MAMTLGAFACILAMRHKDGMVEDINSLAGASKNHPVMAFILAMIMFSLAGIPPLAGFFGKWFVFVAAIEANLYVLAIIGVLASVVGAFYYLRIIKIMYFDEEKGPFEAMPVELRVIMTIAGLFVLFFGLIIGPIGDMAETAAKTFFVG
ncbi:MAG: proton-conducting transporter membrane subunit, partial [Hyphomicrobiales bacterium]